MWDRLVHFPVIPGFAKKRLPCLLGMWGQRFRTWSRGRVRIITREAPRVGLPCQSRPG